MRKSIILAVVVVVALVVAGTSGVFATWSDSETSEFNWIETGSLDLKVNGADDRSYDAAGNVMWGAGVPSKVYIDHMVPCNWYGPFEVELWNAGQCNEVPLAFIHFKNFDCFNVPPKVNPTDPEEGGSDYWPRGTTTGYVCPVTGDLKPEPELVAEFGGKVDCTYVDGIGEPIGDGCSMAAAVEVRVEDEDGNILIGPIVIGNLFCNEIPLFPLPPCEARTINLFFKLYQFTEEDFDYNYFLTPEELGIDPATDPVGYNRAYLHWLKFNDWPSWAYMKDAMWFSMEFDLWLRHDEG
jgi:predicted ribosomally synthesized peptide with SipW-like signal peptide